MLHKFDKGDIALTDRGFGSYHAFSHMTDAGVDAVIRLNGARKVDLEKGEKLGHNDWLVTWEKPSNAPKAARRSNTQRCQQR